MTLITKAVKSRTLIAAYLIAALGVVETQFPVLRAYIPEQYQGLVLVAVGVLMAWLRMVTTEPLDDK